MTIVDRSGIEKPARSRPHQRDDQADGPEGTTPGFRGISFHVITDSREAVDEAVRAAEAAGGSAVKAATAAEWGGYDGYFSDPDGCLWKAATEA